MSESSEPGTLFVLAVAVAREQADPVNEWMTEHGPYPPVEMETPGSDRIWLETYLEEEAAALVLQEAIRNSDLVVEFCEIRLCPHQDWTTFWRHHFQPLEVGDKLLILPEWMQEDPAWQESKAVRETVLINPGLSFGTGDHFTTRFCLRMLDHLVGKGVAPENCFDAGCGSAILSIAAHRFGWRNILAVDYDQVSIDQAHENLVLNGVESGITLQTMDLTKEWPAGTFDVVFANIYGVLLMQLAEQLIGCAGKYLVLSGIRAVETEAVASLFAGYGAKELRCESDHEWSGLLFEV